MLNEEACGTKLLFLDGLGLDVVRGVRRAAPGRDSPFGPALDRQERLFPDKHLPPDRAVLIIAV